MPELAEVEFFRKRWQQGGAGKKVIALNVHPRARVFRGLDAETLVTALTGEKILSSEASGKQLLFRFSRDNWLGVHLGMSGELTVGPADHIEDKHDHLILRTEAHALVFNDPRMFGRVQFAHGPEAPSWWTSLAPPILSKSFTVQGVADFLHRRSRAPIKAVLLMQERFPGIGNWMADEILWRAGVHPRQPAGSLTADEIKKVYRECRSVARLALDTIAGKGRQLPKKLNVNIPRSWLFRHRWSAGGTCPRTGEPLAYATIGGRTTCWSPARQRLHK